MYLLNTGWGGIHSFMLKLAMYMLSVEIQVVDVQFFFWGGGVS
jgi:hypothetical protein